MKQKVAQPYYTRLGFHYFPDTVHYRKVDLQTWLPKLRSLGAHWLTMLAPIERAIPEYFFEGLADENIQPILHFRLPIGPSIPLDTLQLFFQSYARYGVQYITLFDSPNVRSRWPTASWVQDDLVERFLDMYIPMAEMVTSFGMTPVFPPLEPGGDFWDLAFLRSALKSTLRRGHTDLLGKLAISAYAWAGNHPLDWGAGGPDRWPGARPYHTPAGVQDHMGFRIFDWYLAACQEELGHTLPIILLRAGCNIGDITDPDAEPLSPASHAQRNLALARLICEDWNADYGMGSIPRELLACNFWLLAADVRDIYADHAWHKVGFEETPTHMHISPASVDGVPGEFGGSIISSLGSAGVEHLPVVEAFMRWISESHKETPAVKSPSISSEPTPAIVQSQSEHHHPISHYVLLPIYAWGMAEWDLDLVKPLIQKMHPTIGFSLEEARLAERVTVVAGDGAAFEEIKAALHQAGCSVERILNDGTTMIAE